MLAVDTSSPSASSAVGGDGASAPLPDRVNFSEAARRLDLNKSTVSRQVPQLEIDVAADGTFSFAAYVAARAGLNPLKTRNKGDQLGYERSNLLDGFAAPPTQDASAASSTNAVRKEDLGSAHADEKRARAQMLQLDLAERLGTLCPVGEVDAAARDAAAAIQQALEERNRHLAEQLAPMNDARAIELKLAEADRAMLVKIAAHFVPRAKTEEAATDAA